MTPTPAGTDHPLALDEVECIRDLRLRSDGVSTSLARLGDDLVEAHAAVGAGRTLLAAEVEAIGLVSHPHVSGVLDCWTEAETLVTLRPHCSRTLDEIVREHVTVALGAAVTMLVPVASALERMHSLGVVGASLRPRDIVVTDNGAPQLRGCGLRIETDLVTPHWLETSALVAADATAFRRLCESVLECVPDDVHAAIDARDWDVAAKALLAVAPPVPLLSMGESSHAHRDSAVAASRRLSSERITRRMLRGAARQGALSRVIEQLGNAADRVRAGASGVRRRFWVLGFGGLAAIASAALAVAVVAEDPADAQLTDAQTAQPSAPSAEVSVSTPPPEASEAPTASAAPPEAVSEPVDAVRALLEQREACLDEHADTCLEAILMPGSLLHADDLAGEPQWRMAEGSSLELRQELGDAVIVDVVHEEQPASVLAVSTEAGWLLREVWID